MQLKRSLEKFLNPNQLFLREKFRITLSAPDLGQFDFEQPYHNRVNGEVENQVFDKLKFNTTYVESSISNRNTITTELFHDGQMVFKLVEHNKNCPHCGSVDRHYFRKNRKQWRCKHCDGYFSVTHGTPFKDHKLSFKRILLGMMIFIAGANSVSLHQLSRLIKVQVKTAQAFVGKIRETLCGIHAQEKLSGIAHIDGGYFGGRPRPGRVRKRNTPEEIAAHVQAKITGKIKSNQPLRSKMGKMNWHKRQKRRVVMVLRDLYPEPGLGARRTIVAVCRSENESDATELARQYVTDGSLIMTDENPAYNRLSSWYTHKTVQHAVEFSTIDGVNENQAESYFSRLRRYVLGVGLRIEPKYLSDIAVEMAWREDMRRKTEGEKLRDLLSAVFKHGISEWWRGYWQGHHRDGERLWPSKDATARLI